MGGCPLTHFIFARSRREEVEEEECFKIPRCEGSPFSLILHSVTYLSSYSTYFNRSLLPISTCFYALSLEANSLINSFVLTSSPPPVCARLPIYMFLSPFAFTHSSTLTFPDNLSQLLHSPS